LSIDQLIEMIDISSAPERTAPTPDGAK
jgi:hypothetical protein